MKAEQTKKLDAMMGASSQSGKSKGKKKKKGAKVHSTEPAQPPPQDELPISLPPPPSGPGMRVIYPQRRIEPTVETIDQSDRIKADTEEPGEAVSVGKDGGEGDEGESEEEESEEEVDAKQEEEKKKQEKKETREDLISDTYNGAALDDYKWSQTMTDIDVRVPVAPGTKPKDVTVDIKSDHLKIVLHKPERKVNADETGEGVYILLHHVIVTSFMMSS